MSGWPYIWDRFEGKWEPHDWSDLDKWKGNDMNPEAGIPNIETPGMDRSVKVAPRPVNVKAYQTAVTALSALLRPYRPQHVEAILLQLQSELRETSAVPVETIPLGRVEIPNEGPAPTKPAPKNVTRSPLAGPKTKLSDPPPKQTGKPLAARKRT